VSLDKPWRWRYVQAMDQPSRKQPLHEPADITAHETTYGS